MNERATIFYEDMQDLDKIEFIPWEELKNKTILVTGATGLIGFGLISALNYINSKYELNTTILALVRNEKRAKERFQDILNHGML